MIWIGIYLVSVIATYFSIRAWNERLGHDPEPLDVVLVFVPILNVMGATVAISEILSEGEKNWVRKFFFLDK